MAHENTRRWPRHQVKLPVRIIRANDISEIAVPGLTTEISRGGMALYGGVPLQPGDLMEIEFQTSSRLRVAASVRDRTGYCFGLEFLGLLSCENAEVAAADFAEMFGDPGELADSLIIGPSMEDSASSPAARVQVVQGEDEILALFLERHEAYLHQKELEIRRLRYEIEEIRQSRKEIELLALRQVLGGSA
jgi:hypothetical protein